MAYIDKKRVTEFPYDGKFYRIGVDLSLPPSKREEQEITLLDVKCNVQEAGSNLSGNFINASYKVFFPYVNDGVSPFPFNRDDRFKCIINGVEVNGIVIQAFPSQLGKAYVYLKDLEA